MNYDLNRGDSYTHSDAKPEVVSLYEKATTQDAHKNNTHSESFKNNQLSAYYIFFLLSYFLFRIIFNEFQSSNFY